MKNFVFKPILGLFLAAFLGVPVLAASPVLGPENVRNLRLLETSPMLFEMHRLTTGDGKQYFAYPRRDTAFKKNFLQTENNSLLGYDNVYGGYVNGRLADTLTAQPKIALAVSLVGGMDYRGGEKFYRGEEKYYRGNQSIADTIWPSIDGGLYIRGFADSVDFVLDARIYNEGHSAKNPRSFDGEFLEIQRAENNSGIEYTSFARYRTHFAINYDWARLDFGRDVMHWGPGYYNNLTLNQFSLPYNMLSLDLTFGPLHVLSFYGDLRIDANSMSYKNKMERNLFGHRYELALGNATFGVSELQVLYDDLKTWLFVPTAVLFMEKGNFYENSNNGSLSFDFNYRLFKTVRLYTEFFLDDMESPVSLIRNDNIEAKWAWMAGLQAAHDFEIKGHLIEAGTIAEFARVEPYVYSHFHPSTAQLAHLGRPLGNQSGPNSRTIDWTIYGRLDKHIFASLRNTWLWKGRDYGSFVNDTTPTGNHMKLGKEFLKDAKLEYSLTPSVSYEGQYVSYMGEVTLFDDKKVYVRAGFKW